MSQPVPASLQAVEVVAVVRTAVISSSGTGRSRGGWAGSVGWLAARLTVGVGPPPPAEAVVVEQKAVMGTCGTGRSRGGWTGGSNRCDTARAAGLRDEARTVRRWGSEELAKYIKGLDSQAGVMHSARTIYELCGTLEKGGVHVGQCNKNN